YAVVLTAILNCLELIGRFLPVTERTLSRKFLVVAAICRYSLVPCYYFTAKYGGGQGWMICLTSFLGLSHGYLTLCVFIGATQGYK
ncbi:hypothetical protein MKW92_044878, partial [Papaver armeniacum]